MYSLARSRRGEGVWLAQQPDNQRDSPSGGVESSIFHTLHVMIISTLHSGAGLTNLGSNDIKITEEDRSVAKLLVLGRVIERDPSMALGLGH